jgi:hypothetical protein
MLNFKKVIFLFLYSVLSTFSIASAQQQFQYNYETWWGVMTSVRVSEKWSVWNDAHFVDETFFIYRTGMTYHNKRDNIVTTAGYSWLRLTTPLSEGKLIRTEHRPWMQTIFRVPSTKKLSTSFRFRYDARFIQNIESGLPGDGFSFNHRWRFNNALRYNWGNVISEKTVLATSLLNEALFTTGSGPNGVRHEHRTHLIMGLNSGPITYSVGYIVRYINVSPVTARLNHGMVFWLTINLRAIKKSESPFVEFPGDHVD